MYALKEHGSENLYYCGLVFIHNKKTRSKKMGLNNMYPYSTQDLREAKVTDTKEEAVYLCTKINRLNNIQYEVSEVELGANKKRETIVAYTYKTGTELSSSVAQK